LAYTLQLVIASRAYLHDRPEEEVVRRWVDWVDVTLDENAVVEDLHKGVV
jgi:hypothetical protein